MEPGTQAILLMLLGIAVGAVTALAWRISERTLRGPHPEQTEVGMPPGAARVLSVLRSVALVVDEEDRVLQASAPAYALDLVRDGRLRVAALLATVQQVRRDGETRETDLEVTRGVGRMPLQVHVRVAALSSRLVLVLAEDRTRERRVEAIRRDFVANVSHELKTPVGALTLLAEAVQEASDDPEAVQRFAGRMQSEAERLNRLVQQIIELSRLQYDELLDRPSPVDVDRVVSRSVDSVEIEAKDKGVEVVPTGERGLVVLGDADQVELALGNLITNAVTHSSPGSRVEILTSSSTLGGTPTVDIAVVDQGVGIPANELERIFERFYRADPARHRSTGGTGLGLSIVKHVAAAHGGEVLVWSEEGQGSRFTLRLPRRATATGGTP